MDRSIKTRRIGFFRWLLIGIRKWLNGGRCGSQEEAGDVNIAVTVVAPWEEYVGDLCPDFHVSAEEALRRVIPNTGQLEEKVLNVLGATGEVNLTVGAPGDKAAKRPADKDGGGKESLLEPGEEA